MLIYSSLLQSGRCHTTVTSTGTVNTQSTVDRMIAALQVLPSIPRSLPRISGIFPMGMPNMIILTESTAGSSVTIRRSGSIRSGRIRSLTAENRYSRISPKIFLNSERSSVYPTSTSASGDAEIRAENVPEQVELSSKSGDCCLRLPEGEGFTLQFRTVSGELETDFPLVGPVGSRSGEAIYLDGGGRTFLLSSVSGDISLRRL